jgi:hypothetical protein
VRRGIVGVRLAGPRIAWGYSPERENGDVRCNALRIRLVDTHIASFALMPDGEHHHRIQ